MRSKEIQKARPASSQWGCSGGVHFRAKRFLSYSALNYHCKDQESFSEQDRKLDFSLEWTVLKLHVKIMTVFFFVLKRVPRHVFLLETRQDGSPSVCRRIQAVSRILLEAVISHLATHCLQPRSPGCAGDRTILCRVPSE